MSRKTSARAALAVAERKPDDAQQAQSAAPDGQEAIPPHVMAILQEAGEEAAQRLLELLRSKRFALIPASQQRGLIELALTRAYGLPVRRSVNVSIGKDDLDAIAHSLSGLTDALPERQVSPRDITPADD